MTKQRRNVLSLLWPRKRVRLYHLRSSCSIAVRAALNMINMDYDLEVVDPAHKSREFLAANPLGNVPTLERRGRIITEGGAINLFLSQLNPRANLMPKLDTPEGGEALRWLFFMYATLHPVWSRVFSPQRYAGEQHAATVKAQAERDAHRLFGIINDQLTSNRYIAGDRLTLADLYLVVCIHWESQLQKPLTVSYPALIRYRDRMLAHPKVAQAFAGEFNYQAMAA